MNIIYRKDIEHDNIYSLMISINEVKTKFFQGKDYIMTGSTEKLNFNKVNDLLNNYFSQEEIEKKIFGFKVLKRQVEWISGRIAAKELMSSIYKGLDKKEIQIEAKAGGSPFIRQLPHINISLSHSGGYAAAALSLDTERRVGIDIEKIGTEKSNEFKRLVFSEKEIEHLQSRDTECLYRSWSIKEAYLKMTEKGFDTILKNIEVFDEKIFVNNFLKTDIKIISDTIFDNYIFALVYRNIN